MNALGVGLLGWSGIARRRFLPALQSSTRARLAAIGTRRPAEAARSAPPVRLGSYESLLADPEVELVYVSLPNHLHEEWSCRALAAGKHVLCEKPLAPSLAAVERMREAARVGGRLLAEVDMYRHHPQHRVVRDLVADGRIGRLRLLRTGFTFRQEQPDDFRRDPQRGGGVSNDLLSYVVGAAGLHLPGPLVACTGFSRWQGGVDVAVVGTGHAAGGELFSFSISFEQAYECFYELIGERGRLRLDRAFSVPAGTAGILRLETDTGPETIPLPAADQFQLMLDALCDRIRGGDDPGPHDERLGHAHRQLDLVRRGLQRMEAVA